MHQRSNAALAVAMVKKCMASSNCPALLRDSWSDADQHQILLKRALESARWPGRCQEVEDRQSSRKGVTWYLDGAHTVESLQCCADWFAGEIGRKQKSVCSLSVGAVS